MIKKKLQERKSFLSAISDNPLDKISLALGMAPTELNRMTTSIKNLILIELLIEEQIGTELKGEDFIEHCKKLLHPYV